MLKIVLIPINEIKPYHKNAKLHTGDQIQHLMNAIREYGFSVPIGVSGANNVIVYGHGRWLAAKKLGIKEVPCVRLDHLTEEQQQAYRLADNSTEMMTGFDYSKLDAELNALFDFDKMSFGFGFSPKDTDDDFGPATSETSPKAKGNGKDGGAGGSMPRKNRPAQYKCPGCGHIFNPAFEDAVNEGKTPVEDFLDEALKEVL